MSSFSLTCLVYSTLTAFISFSWSLICYLYSSICFFIDSISTSYSLKSSLIFLTSSGERASSCSPSAVESSFYSAFASSCFVSAAFSAASFSCFFSFVASDWACSSLAASSCASLAAFSTSSWMSAALDLRLKNARYWIGIIKFDCLTVCWDVGFAFNKMCSYR